MDASKQLIALSAVGDPGQRIGAGGQRLGFGRQLGRVDLVAEADGGARHLGECRERLEVLLGRLEGPGGADAQHAHQVLAREDRRRDHALDPRRGDRPEPPSIDE